ncbi:MAG: hypothetical protein ACFFFG_10760 [Candidatus Thorarchaeota archaeon]
MVLEPAYTIELESFLDLVRLVTNSGPERPSTIFKWSTEESRVNYGSFAIFPGYYDYHGLPVLFYVTHETSIEKVGESIIRYDLQVTDKQVSFLSHLEERDLGNTHTGLVRFIPIVTLKRPPKIFPSGN